MDKIEPTGEMARRRRSRLLLVLWVLFLLLLGVGLLLLPSGRSFERTIHELTRDLGISCILSALVTAAYEIYIRRRLDLENLSSLLETVYGSGVPLPVWRRVIATVLQRDWLRKNVVLRLRVLRDPGIPPEKIVLDLTYEYQLVNLTEKALNIPVGHALDDHIAVTAANLPRFITVGTGSGSALMQVDASTGWHSPSGDVEVMNGRLNFSVSVPSRSDIPIHVRRCEVRECPGSYFLLMDELIDGLRIHLDEYPTDVRVLATVRPTIENVDLVAKRQIQDVLPLLPGHGIEFKFIIGPVAH